MDPGFAITCPRSTSSFSTPRSSNPTLSPARPSSSSFLNISTPVTTVLRVSRKPTISISSPTLQIPFSMRPVTTVPRPWIEKMSSSGIRYVLAKSRFGICSHEFTHSICPITCFSHFSLPSIGPRACDSARFFFRRIVDRIERPELHLGVVLPQYLRDGRREGGLAVIDVSDRPDVHVRFAAVKFFLSHKNPLVVGGGR